MEKAISHMMENGLSVTPSLPLELDGEIHRFKTNGSGKAGWYVGDVVRNIDSDYVWVSYGDWQSGVEGCYCSHRRDEVPAQVSAEYKKREFDRRVEKERKKAEAFSYMTEMWENANSPNPHHPYLVKKKFDPTGFIKQSGDMLLVPVFDEQGEIISVQRIYPNGEKRFIKGLSIKFGYFALGHITDGDTVYVTESFGNAFSIYNSMNAATVCSFSAQTIPSLVSFINNKHVNLTVIVVADRDSNRVGQDCAEKAEKAHDNVSVVLPSINGMDKCDISDVYIKEGAEGVRECLLNTKVCDDGDSSFPSITSAPSPDLTYLQGEGIIAEIVDYYNATSIQKRPGFALQTALSFCSIILGRKYKTEYNHHPSLYFLNIGKSGSGKEHQMTVVQGLLEETKQESLLGASGYTSPGAIATALLEAPAHITLIDEFGDYLISLNDKKSSQRLVNRCLLQLFGRCNGSYIGEQYSKFSKVVKGDEKVIIKNPALTLLAAVQPSKFYSNVNSSLISDGFLGRFIVYECEEANEPVHLKRRDRVATDQFVENIKTWVDIVNKRFSNPIHYMSGTDPSVSPQFVSIQLDDDALTKYNEFSDYITNELSPKLEEFNASELVSRWPYMIGSLSLITALSRDPYTAFINKSDVQYAISIIKSFGERFVDNLIDKINSSQYEQDKNEFLAAIRACGKDGISTRDLSRKKPFYRFPRRDRNAILDDLLESELVSVKQLNSSSKRASVYYYTGEQAEK